MIELWVVGARSVQTAWVENSSVKYGSSPSLLCQIYRERQWYHFLTSVRRGSSEKAPRAESTEGPFCIQHTPKLVADAPLARLV